MTLPDQLTELQFIAMKRGWEECARWLAKQVALMEKGQPKRRRKRGRWVRLAKTGKRVFLDADKVREAEKAEENE